MTTWVDELDTLADQALALSRSRPTSDTDLEAELRDRASSIERSWSGSNLGYHAVVYYENFAAPPPGAHFSIEWGLGDFLSGSRGNWAEIPRDAVWEACCGDKDSELNTLEENSRSVEAATDEIVDEARSILNACQKDEPDRTIANLIDELQIRKPSLDSVTRAFMRTGQVMSRDAIAVGQGFRSAPHQELEARLAYASYSYSHAEDVSKHLRSAARYLNRLTKRPAAGRQAGTHIFIGHGHSEQWRILKDFLSDRLGLLWNEFNSVPMAGMSNVQRLSDCLDQANFALLVLTAEDEMADSSLSARQNVIHEVGLFQGRLGFAKAIVLLEDGCNEFSNINGLGQLRFPTGNIGAIFEEVRRVLERETLLEL